MKPNSIIRTSNQGWPTDLANCYRHRITVIIIDDANLGIDPLHQTLFEMTQKSDLSWSDWASVAVACGVGGTGVYILRLAAADPEPVTKAMLLGIGGAVTLGGFRSALSILTKTHPPSVTVEGGGFKVSWTEGQQGAAS